MNTKVTTATDLIAISVPTQTNTYKPISHKQLIHLTLEQANKNGFILTNTNYRVSHSGKVATAYYDFNFGNDNEIGLRVAWQNSYNKQISAKYVIGAHVFVCSNGAFQGDLNAFKKKHIGHIQDFIPNEIKKYFENAYEIYQEMVKSKNKMKQINISNITKAELIGDLYINRNLIKETQIAIIKKEIDKPSFNYNSKNSVWEIYNIITHSFKTIHPTNYISSHIDLHKYFKEKFDI